MLFLLLVACANDFGLAQAPKGDTGSASQSDTGTPAQEDTGADTAADTGDSRESTDTTDTTPSHTGDDTDPTSTGTDSAVDSGTPPVDTGDSAVDDPPPADDCSETDDLVYVLSRDASHLYTFDPAALSFTDLGRVDCGTTQTPGSMAVSRDGVAYIRYSDNMLYSLDLATMTCSRTSYSDRTTGFDSFGMGYATDSAETWRDQLYVANDHQVGTLDTSTWRITTLGSMPSQSELTGNADGELWAMLPLERPAELARIDTTSGSTVETLRLSSFPDPSNIDTFAFATWDGNFYLFVREYGMGESTDVYKVTRAGSMTQVLSNIGFDIVGAGVSTCAPS